jgi:hypothetical protein
MALQLIYKTYNKMPVAHGKLDPTEGLTVARIGGGLSFQGSTESELQGICLAMAARFLQLSFAGPVQDERFLDDAESAKDLIRAQAFYEWRLKHATADTAWDQALKHHGLRGTEAKSMADCGDRMLLNAAVTIKEKRGRHAIAMVKNVVGFYLLDPNFGLFRWPTDDLDKCIDALVEKYESVEQEMETMKAYNIALIA